MSDLLLWQHRFRQQAAWTAQLRQYVYTQVGISNCKNIVEVGCGMGAVLEDLPLYTPANVLGLDINFAYCQSAAQAQRKASICCADAYHLPLPDNYCDICLCHFFLMWVDPKEILTEMVRITHSGGAILALAEPDYGGRIDYPENLSLVGQLQSNALKAQGADPDTGRKLAGLFTGAGLTQVEYGLMGGHWQNHAASYQPDLELQVLENDLSGWIPEKQLQEIIDLENKSRQMGERVLFVPTFYAWGKVK